MTAKEIRDAAKALDEIYKNLPDKDKPEVLLPLVAGIAFGMICEVAAQLADLNENIKKLPELEK